MSLYNIMCGVNPAAGRLLLALGLAPSDVPRLRDAWTNDEMTEVSVYTRVGGGNRSSYEEGIARLQGHPGYVRDYDDDFDNTYATFVFKLPEDQREAMKKELTAALENDEGAIKEVMKAITQTGPDKTQAALAALKKM
jgi:hypothetical protein